MNNPDDLRRQARELAAKAKGAKAAWAELSKWTVGKGPLAVKSAIIEFMGSYGSSPEAARMMPELVRMASQFPTPSERRQLLELTTKKLSPVSTISPKMNVPSEKERPALSISFSPSSKEVRRLGGVEPFSPSADHAAIRDIHLSVKERMSMQLYAPLPKPQAQHFDASKSPDTFSMQASHQGQHLIRSLIHKVSSHSRDPGHKVEEPPRIVRKKPKKAKPKFKAKAKARPKKARARPKAKRPKKKARKR